MLLRIAGAPRNSRRTAPGCCSPSERTSDREKSVKQSPLHPLRRTKSMLDPIYGLIWLTSEELKVISDPLFQRLRGIKQNGLLHYVFHSATHTRFEHSIGALWVADEMLQALIRNSQVATSEGKESVKNPGAVRPGQAIDFSALDHRTMEFVFRITRLAALVHDLGHGPLSHTFDSFAPKKEELLSVLSGESWKYLRPVIESETGPRVSHEVMSCVLFDYVWRRQFGPGHSTPLLVASAILGPDKLAPPNVECRIWLSLISSVRL